MLETGEPASAATTRASCLALSSSLVISTRPLNRKHQPAMVALLHSVAPAANPNCKIGMIVAGFMVLHESQTRWLVVSDGSIKVVLAVSGLSATEQTWHYEQWLHLKIAGRKCRRELSSADSKSRQKIVLHTNKRATGVIIGLLRKLLLATCAGLLFNLCWLHRIDVPTSTVGMFCPFFVILG